LSGRRLRCGRWGLGGASLGGRGFFLVEFHAGEGCVFIVGMFRCESGSITSVVLVPGDAASVALEVWLMVLREALLQAESDR